jgi:transcriptional regulator with XRE-family HTH domain
MGITYLARLLQQNELSQNQLSKYIGLHQSRISLLCTGQAQPNQRERQKLTEFFGLSIDLIVGEYVREDENE